VDTVEKLKVKAVYSC